MDSAADKLDPGSPENPQPFGKYLLMGMIARGGMAEVYVAEAESMAGFKKKVAIKQREYESKCRGKQSKRNNFEQ